MTNPADSHQRQHTRDLIDWFKSRDIPPVDAIAIMMVTVSQLIHLNPDPAEQLKAYDLVILMIERLRETEGPRRRAVAGQTRHSKKRLRQP
jgi:hypothetical protein